MSLGRESVSDGTRPTLVAKLVGRRIPACSDSTPRSRAFPLYSYSFIAYTGNPLYVYGARLQIV
jgi:hypothetical protein